MIVTQIDGIDENSHNIDYNTGIDNTFLSILTFIDYIGHSTNYMFRHQISTLTFCGLFQHEVLRSVIGNRWILYYA